MTPFRERAVKWDGNDGNGRYKNKKGFKFDIITKKVAHSAEDMPKCFLADTPAEAQAIYSKFESLLNSMAYTYAVSSNLDKSDLFGEGLIGLARAYRDWDETRSDNFKNYAIYKIKDALNECVRGNAASVSVPSHIRKAHNNLVWLKSFCEAKGIDWQLIKESPSKFPYENIDLENCVANIQNAAKRAGVEFNRFLERIEHVPEDAEYADQDSTEQHVENEKRIEAALVVDQIKRGMDEEEQRICDGIMYGKTYEEIGAEFGKSKAWVAGKLKDIRERVVEKLGANID